jgi:hypothetical protein
VSFDVDAMLLPVPSESTQPPSARLTATTTPAAPTATHSSVLPDALVRSIEVEVEAIEPSSPTVRAALGQGFGVRR